MEIDLEEEDKKEEPSMEINLEEEDKEEEPSMEINLEEEDKEEEPSMEITDAEKGLSLDEIEDVSQTGVSLDEIDAKVTQLADKVSNPDKVSSTTDTDEVDVVEEKPKKKKSMAGVLLTGLVLVWSVVGGSVYMYFNYPDLVSSILWQQASSITDNEVSNENNSDDLEMVDTGDNIVSGTNSVATENESIDNQGGSTGVDKIESTEQNQGTNSSIENDIDTSADIGENLDSTDETESKLNSKDINSASIDSNENLTGNVIDDKANKQPNTNYSEQAKQLIKEVKLLLIKNYKIAKKKNDNQTKLILAKILKKINKLNPENANQKMMEVLNKFKSTLTTRLEAYSDESK